MGRVAKVKSCAGGAALGKNGEGRTHHPADGALGNAREMFGKEATVGEFSGVPGPGQAQAPGLVEFLGAGSSNLADGDIQERLEAPVENEDTFDADEELRGSRRRASLLIAPSIDDNQSCQFSGFVWPNDEAACRNSPAEKSRGWTWRSSFLIFQGPSLR
ncbi:MAG: hypothetical protein DMG53_22540 [Acidobacteria bacterium]|nr:MAG: hypothetical protein DMG53_22540 [Acidobacteriota bacterium]